MTKFRYHWLCLPILIYFHVLAKLTHATVPGCKKKLEWFEKRFISDTETFSLRVCCNVKKLWLGLLTDGWSIQEVDFQSGIT
uniref:Secreted protein n=1 Tax=Romanomermis culicivorax TaxID=13658 RepID=A0A915HVI8_ROMCU